MIYRFCQRQIKKRLSDEKAIILLGPCQVGKSTLLRQMESVFPKPVLWWDGDQADVRSMLEHPTSTKLKSLIGRAKTLIIDEAQRIQNIGLCIKLITDNIPKVKVIASGSSSFDLANKINEPLTGRKWEFHLYPISYGEMVKHHGAMEEKRLLEHRMVFGYYPEIVNHPGDERQRLTELVNSYLYKDILMWERIQKPERMEKLVQALALQLGNEISYNELGQLSGMDNETVEKYIALLEKAFIVFRLMAFSRNLRNELKKSRKIYFYDNGVRNAIINQFNPVSLRQDVGALWENFLISERVKFLAYNNLYCHSYFWRTHSQQEIDYIEEFNGKISAFEFKWHSTQKTKFPSSFIETYHPIVSEIVSKENFESFLHTIPH